jgi:hypothetical protein
MIRVNTVDATMGFNLKMQLWNRTAAFLCFAQEKEVYSSWDRNLSEMFKYGRNYMCVFSTKGGCKLSHKTFKDIIFYHKHENSCTEKIIMNTREPQACKYGIKSLKHHCLQNSD